MPLSVIFESLPNPSPQNPTTTSTYHSFSNTLLPPLAASIPGYVSNPHYRSLTRPGWYLSLSTWLTEEALVTWRGLGTHRDAQRLGRGEVYLDYRLRVGWNLGDWTVGEGKEGRLGDGGKENYEREGKGAGEVQETVVGEAKIVILVDAVVTAVDAVDKKPPEVLAVWLGLDVQAVSMDDDLVSWDIWEEDGKPGHLTLMTFWKKQGRAVEELEKRVRHLGSRDVGVDIQKGMRVRKVRISRDYGMFDRREAPQFYPDAKGRETIH